MIWMQPFGKKDGKTSKGQTINLTETAHPDNGLNLLTDISVQKNNIDESKILEQRIEKLKKKTQEIAELHFDRAEYLTQLGYNKS